jgi:hypothetical protein
MRIPRTLALLVSVAAVAGLVPGAAAAASDSYAVTGLETAATSTQGTFVGRGAGSSGDRAVWRAVVIHQSLSSSCLAAGCPITGGTLKLATDRFEVVSGTFTSGAVTLASEAPGCGTQVFSVAGTLATTGGAGTFTVSLTHYRALIFGQCTAFAATVAGSVSIAGP